MTCVPRHRASKGSSLELNVLLAVQRSHTVTHPSTVAVHGTWGTNCEIMAAIRDTWPLLLQEAILHPLSFVQENKISHTGVATKFHLHDDSLGLTAQNRELSSLRPHPGVVGKSAHCGLATSATDAGKGRGCTSAVFSSSRCCTSHDVSHDIQPHPQHPLCPLSLIPSLPSRNGSCPLTNSFSYLSR